MRTTWIREGKQGRPLLLRILPPWVTLPTPLPHIPQLFPSVYCLENLYHHLRLHLPFSPPESRVHADPGGLWAPVRTLVLPSTLKGTPSAGKGFGTEGHSAGAAPQQIPVRLVTIARWFQHRLFPQRES